MAGKTSVFTDYSAPSVDAGWLNIQQTEQKNFIESSGQTLADGTLDQEAISVASYAAQGNVFTTDSGAADAYILTQVSPFKAPYSLKNGMTITFRAGNANTGAATVNAFGLGVKSIKQADGSSALTTGMISTTADTQIRYDGTNFRLTGSSVLGRATTSVSGTSLLPSQITISNNVSDANNDIDFTAGNFQFSDGSGQASLSALTKRLDASWAAGTNQGGLFSGSKANSTWYYCFAIYNPTTSAVDCGFDTSITAANIPSGYTKHKRVGSIRTDGSGNIIAFTQSGNQFLFVNKINDRSIASSLGTTSRVLLTVTCPPSCEVIMNGIGNGSSGDLVNITSPSAADAATTSDNAIAGGNFFNGWYLRILTNSSSQIAIRSSATGYYLSVNTLGYIDSTLV